MLVLIVLYSLFIGCTQEHGINQKITNDLTIQNMIEEISTETLFANIKTLQDFQTRYPYHRKQEVAEYLFKELSKYNLEVDCHVYDYWGVPWWNVVATLPGEEDPEKNYYRMCPLRYKIG